MSLPAALGQISARIIALHNVNRIKPQMLAFLMKNAASKNANPMMVHIANPLAIDLNSRLAQSCFAKTSRNTSSSMKGAKTRSNDIAPMPMKTARAVRRGSDRP